MDVLLADRLSCPRCGPRFGLILLAERVHERRVIEGRLGCPNCRDRFAVAAGVADLRAPPRAGLPAPDAPPRADPAVTERLHALLGVDGPGGRVALVGDVAAGAGPLADLLPDVEVVAIGLALRGAPERGGVSRLLAGPGLPFFDATFRGVAVSGGPARELLEEAARVAAAGARVVALDSPRGARARLEASGLHVLLDDATARAVVAQRQGHAP